MSHLAIIKKESKEKVYSNAGNVHVMNLIPSNAMYILDIGCGDGSTAKLFTKRPCIIDGITISEAEKLEAEKIMRHVYIYNVESGLPFTGKDLYDVVICSHVLEHICYPQQLMNERYIQCTETRWCINCCVAKYHALPVEMVTYER